jgi:dTMP kinase
MNQFVVFEGIDGCGKSTLSKRFAERMSWSWTREPTFSSEQADELNLKSKDDIGREIEFAIDRIKHVFEMEANENSFVCDRYIWTGLVYCSKYNPKAFSFVREFYAHEFFRKPDWYIFVDTPIDICYERIVSREGKEIQSLNDLSSLRQLYKSLEYIVSKNSKIITIESLGKIDDLVDSILNLMGKNSGYGMCPDCDWFLDKEGCNVERDSKVCLLNRKLRQNVS